MPGSFPTTGLLDNFNRANEGPPPSASWAGPIWSGQSGIVVASNVAAGSAAGWRDGYWNTSLGVDQEVYATMSSVATGGNSIYLHARITSVGGSVPNSAFLRLVGPTNFLPSLGVMVAGSYDTLWTAASSVTVSAGDKFGLECRGNYIYGYYWKAAEGYWKNLGMAYTTTNVNAGFIGAEFNDTALRWDDFGGGEIVAATPSVAPLGNDPLASTWLRATSQLIKKEPSDAGPSVWSNWLFGEAGVVERFGATASTYTFGATTAGVRESFGATATPIAFTATTAGVRTAFGATASPIAFTATTAGVRTAFGATATPIVFSATTAGFKETFGATATPIVFSATTAGARERFGATASTYTFSATTAGVRTAFGATATPITFTADAAGTRTAFGVAALPIVFGAAAAGVVERFGATASTYTFGATTAGATTAGSSEVRGSTSSEWAFGASSSGYAEKFGSCSLQITLMATTTLHFPATPRRRLNRIELRRKGRRYSG